MEEKQVKITGEKEDTGPQKAVEEKSEQIPLSEIEDPEERKLERWKRNYSSIKTQGGEAQA